MREGKRVPSEVCVCVCGGEGGGHTVIMKLKEKKYTFHLDITKSLIDYDGAKLKKVGSDVGVVTVATLL